MVSGYRVGNSGEAWLCRGDAMRRRAQSPRRVAPPVSHATTGEVVVAWLKLLTLSASGGGQAHAVRRAADGWLRDRSSPPPTPSRHHFMSGGADVMDAHMRALSGCGGRIASAACPCT